MTLEYTAIGQLEDECPRPKAEDEEAHAFAKPKKPSLLRRVVVKVRLLPMVIFFSTLMLTVRVGDIWEGVDGVLNGTVSVSSAEAQAQTTPAPAPTSAAVPPAGLPGLPGGAPAGGAAPAAKAMAGSGIVPMMPQESRAAVAARMLADDPTLLTRSEIDLLQKLAKRRVQIDARAKELEMRSAMLDAAESRIDGKIQEFKALQATIEGLVKKYDQQQTKKLLSLVKIYENMKPKDAARIFEKLDMNTLLQVAERMKERKLAPVMAKMNPQRAREITVALNQLRTLPAQALVGP